MSRDDEREALIAFRGRYGVAPTEITCSVEREVLGFDWGANGYTTRAQADRLRQQLALQPSDRLLDIGSGRGWPGLYLAASSGCEVVLTDMPLEGLRLARRRVRQEGLEEAARAVACSASAPAFGPAAFDGVVHTDVL